MVEHSSKRSSLLDQGSPPGVSESNGTSPKLEVVVLFTSPGATIAAMHGAAALLQGLNGHISLLDFKTVPHQLPLDNPPISVDFIKRRLLAIASASFVETSAYVYLCRCPLALMSILKPGTLIVIACRGRWWPTWETKLAEKLRHEGYQIILHKSD
jgi:hypothetical protein